MKQIKDFKMVLRDFEPMIKNPKFLHNGREFSNFSLRPREAWANWLLCVVLQKIHGEEITFMEDQKGDGIILVKKTKEWIMTEHVSALEIPCGKKLPKGEARIIDAINLKIKKGSAYAKNTFLIVFFDGAGEFCRSTIRESINGRHNFACVYCIGLLTADENGYAYSVTEFHEQDSITFKVQINSNFTAWEVSKIE